jgi:hypothetical protein
MILQGLVCESILRLNWSNQNAFPASLDLDRPDLHEIRGRREWKNKFSVDVDSAMLLLHHQLK